MTTWIIWRLHATTNARHAIVAIYHNRGHALSRLRGLIRASHRAGSEMCYTVSQAS